MTARRRRPEETDALPSCDRFGGQQPVGTKRDEERRSVQEDHRVRGGGVIQAKIHKHELGSEEQADGQAVDEGAIPMEQGQAATPRPQRNQRRRQ